MKQTKPLTLVLSALAAGVVGGIYGLYQVSHGHALPTAHINSLVPMPAIAIVLAFLAYPVYRYRKQSLDYTKAASASAITARPERPKRLDPFYAVRVLLLAKSTSVASAAIAGFHIGLVLLQLSTPVVANGVWLNIAGVAGGLLAMVVGLIVERICRIPDGGVDAGNQSSEAAA